MNTDFQNAVKAMANGSGFYDLELREEIIQVLNDEVEPLCKTPTHNNRKDDRFTKLSEWLWSGCYKGNETPEQIAEEWDSQFNPELDQ